VGEVYEDQKIFDVAVWSPDRLRSDLPSLTKLFIDTPLGGKVPLGDLAELRIAPTPNVIQHENASRRIDVSCNVKDRDLGSVAREIEQRVRSVNFPPGYHPELLGEYAARQASQNRLLGLSFLAMVGILLVLYSDFKSVASLDWAMTGTTLLLAVGAAFDYHAGLLRNPPPWMQKYALEWLWRLGHEPKRLWRRYILLNPAYLARLAAQKTGLWKATPPPPATEPLDKFAV